MAPLPGVLSSVSLIHPPQQSLNEYVQVLSLVTLLGAAGTGLGAMPPALGAVKLRLSV